MSTNTFREKNFCNQSGKSYRKIGTFGKSYKIV